MNQVRLFTQSLYLVIFALTNSLLEIDEVLYFIDKNKVELDRENADFAFKAIEVTDRNKLEEYLQQFQSYKLELLNVRPLIHLLSKKYQSGAININEALNKLNYFKQVFKLSADEKSYIYLIDTDYELDSNVQSDTMNYCVNELQTFFTLYKDYSIFSAEKWTQFDLNLQLFFSRR